jgi:hypothetical protein
VRLCELTLPAAAVIVAPGVALFATVSTYVKLQLALAASVAEPDGNVKVALPLPYDALAAGQVPAM